MKIKMLAAVTAFMAGMTLLAPTASFADAPSTDGYVNIPVSAGLTPVAPGTTTTLNNPDGTVDTIVSGDITRAPWPAGFAHPLGNTSFCWTYDYVLSHGVSSDSFHYEADYFWCGNEATRKILGTPTMKIYGSVGTIAQLDGWQYMGIQNHGMDNYYNSGAYQGWSQGKFQGCPFRVIICKYYYPSITLNMYPDGEINIWGNW